VTQYQSSGVFNVAFPGYAVFGGVLASVMMSHFLVYPYYAFPFCIVIGAIIGALQWTHISFLTVRKQKPELVLLSCFGVLIVLEGLAYTLYYLLRPIFFSALYFPNMYEVFILNIPLRGIIAVATLLITMYSIYLIEKKGTSYKAIAENTELAQIQGINTFRFNKKLWIMSGVIICTIGSFIEIERHLNIYSYTFVLFSPVVAGAFLGGVKSLKMAFLGGFIVAMLELWIPFALQPFIPTIGEYSSLFPIAVLCIALLYKSHKNPGE
jgi:branched-subunit amino acid ABC-type transport system permease component